MAQPSSNTKMPLRAAVAGAGAGGMNPGPFAYPSQQATTSKDWVPALTELESSAGIPKDALALYDQIQKHEQFEEYFDSIRIYIEIEDSVWNAIYTLRSHHVANEALRSLHRSIYREPSESIWRLLVELRSHKHWNSIQPTILCLIDEFLEEVTAAYPSSNKASSMRPPSSFSNYSKHTSTGSGFTPHRSDAEEIDMGTDGPTLIAREATSPAYNSLKNSALGRRKAPEGHAFCCPSKNCKRTFSSVGNYFNHVDKVHPDLPEHDPSRSLRQVPQNERRSNTNRRNQAPSTELGNQIMAEIPQAPAVSAAGRMLFPDYQAGLRNYDYQTNFQYSPYPNQLSSQGMNIVAAPDWCGFSNTGVQILPDNTSSYVHNTAEGLNLQERSHFDDNSDMEDGQE